MEGSLGKARARHGSFLCLQCFKEKFQRRKEADLRKNRRKTGVGEDKGGENRLGRVRKRKRVERRRGREEGGEELICFWKFKDYLRWEN